MEIQKQNRRLATWVHYVFVVIVVLIFVAIGLSILRLLVQLNVIHKPWSTSISSIFAWIIDKAIIAVGGVLTIVTGIIIATFKDIWHWLFSKGIYQRPTVGSRQPGTFPVDAIMTIPPQPLPDSVSALNVPLTDRDEFFGRKREYDKIVGRIKKDASSSIVGPRHIGKSWLLSYLKLSVPTELDADFKYQIGYLDANLPSCHTVDGFVKKVLEKLNVPLPEGQPATLKLLEETVQGLRAIKKVPVLCIDEFEGLTKEQEFNYDFFTNLRAISQLQGGGLVLVTASKSPLITLVSSATRSSKFFNIFREFRLAPFTKLEAQRFIQAKAQQAGFSPDEQTYILDHAQKNNQWHPVRLQIAVDLLLEDKRLDQDNPGSYRPNEWEYDQLFQQRLEQEYATIVRDE